ncbi:SMI1/KNR4 family protein [Haliscomenobacter sp.]|uniref:SMI1/KNR4 family protein n=1 Tax=Haliscomenobacter sp. TaxID=2717303 RepID=UPI0035935A0A
MEELIQELLKFSPKILDIGSPINDNRVQNFELKYGLLLPDDFKNFMNKHNGLNLMGTEVLCFDISDINSIENVYHFEHFEVINPQYTYLVPFSPDGGGNFYCFDTSKRSQNGDCQVVFWQSDYIYSEQDTPDFSSNNFIDWVKTVVISWTLEDYHYDGSKK